MENKLRRVLFLVILTALTVSTVMSCSNVTESQSLVYEGIDVEQYIEKQLAFEPMCKPEELSHRFIPVQVLGINDFHGQLTGRTVSGRPAGNAAVLASYLAAACGESEGPTFIVSVGDLVGASIPESALLQDEPTIMFFNMLGNRFCTPNRRMHPMNNLVAVPGNHEFDEGKDELMRLVYGGNHENGPFLQDPYEGSSAPFVCANVVYEKNGRPFLPPLVLKNVKGVWIAFLGAVLEDTPSIVTASGLAGLEFLDEAETVNRYVHILKRFGIRSIVVVLHQGAYQDSYEGPTKPGVGPGPGPLVDIVKELDGEVDVVLSAHSHGFTNALIPSRDGNDILVTQAWSKSTAYADIDLKINRKTKDIVEKSACIMTTWADEGPGLTPDPEIAELVETAIDAVSPLTEVVVAEAATDITRTSSYAGESALGNLIADAQRSAGETDFALMNPGGIRADITAGEVTWGKLYTVQPFNNYLVTMELTGQQVYDLLNQQWAGQPYPRVLEISGLTYTWAASRPEADRIVEVRKGGLPIDRSSTYTVTVNSFLADGGDNFTVLRDGTNRITGPIDLDALISYLKGLPQPFSSSIEGRIERLN